jgi:multidrug resistance efflux pump
VTSAEADLESAEQQLGVEGPDNPDLRAAVAALEQAQLDLAFTTLHAPATGVVEHFNIDIGHYAQAGQPLATFVTTNDVWIQADMRENNISNIEPGDPAEVILDVAPGQIFRGTVRSVGYGVSTGREGSRGELVSVSQSTGWLRDPQRFPVIIRLDQNDARGLLRVGGQANVVVFTGNNWILNVIARLRIRLSSVVSYVR